MLGRLPNQKPGAAVPKAKAAEIPVLRMRARKRLRVQTARRHAPNCLFSQPKPSGRLFASGLCTRSAGRFPAEGRKLGSHFLRTGSCSQGARWAGPSESRRTRARTSRTPACRRRPRGADPRRCHRRLTAGFRQPACPGLPEVRGLESLRANASCRPAAWLAGGAQPKVLRRSRVISLTEGVWYQRCDGAPHSASSSARSYAEPDVIRAQKRLDSSDALV